MNHAYTKWAILLGLLLLAGCGESDLLEDYFVDNPRILAVKVEDPEVRPGDRVAMRMLVGGRSINQQMAADVYWAIDDSELEFIGTSDYTQAFEYYVPGDALPVEGWYNLPIYARIQLPQKALNAQKDLRVTQTPVDKNPVISGAVLQYFSAGLPFSQTALPGDTISIPADAANIALTALTESLPAGANDKLVYRWYVSLSKNTAGKLYIQYDSDKIENLLGPGAEASELRPSAVFSLRGEDDDDPVQSGIYDIYLVVRDNATDPKSLADERYGTDFVYFTLCVNSGC